MHRQGHNASMRKLGAGSPWVVGGVIAAVLGALALTLDRMAHERAIEQARNEVSARTALQRAHLERQLNAALYSMEGLAHLVSARANSPIDHDDFEAFAREIHGAHDFVLNVNLAPGNVIQYIYPLSGNEEALGLDLEAHPEQGPSVRRMMEIGATVANGPTELVQGGQALILRTPVKGPDNNFWGSTTIPLDLEQILENAGLHEPGDLRLALRGHDGLGPDGDPFFGDPELFHHDSIRHLVHFGENEWEFAAKPAVGWSEYAQPPALARALGLFIVLGASVAGGLLTAQAHRIRQVSQRLRMLMDAMPDVGFVVNDQGCIRQAFGGQERGLYHDTTGFEGRSVQELLSPTMARFVQHCVQQALEDDTLVILEYPFEPDDLPGSDPTRNPPGEQWYQGRIYPLPDGLERRPAVLWLAYNITEQRAIRIASQTHEERIRHLAMHDPLTGLANRTLLIERLNQGLRQARRYGSRVGLLFIDLDHFKPVNDQHGHDAGDLVLQEIGRRLATLVRESDTVARYGGDEFVVLLPDVSDSAGAQAVADKAVAAISQPVVVELDGREVECRLGASVGISIYPDFAENADALQRTADDAMYAAKAAGRNRYALPRG